MSCRNGVSPPRCLALVPELFARRELAVARGVSVMLPAFIVDAGGGVLIDVDGNSLIDLGSGIAVTSVGNAAPRVVDGVQARWSDSPMPAS